MTTPSSGPVDDPIADLSALLGQLAGDSGATPPTTEPSAEPADQPVYRNVEAFVGGYLAHVVERRLATGPTSGVNWCPRWWAHPEAISRLYALWRTWETLRVSDPQTGMSIWWRDHLDPHLAALTTEYGPFSRCSPDKHTEPKPLPVEPAPAEVLAQLPDVDTL
ncbi:hypothetical protein GCM10029963_79230 [Micromonospora andamanensis]|uniref:DUF4913 domain-containing protein n=1 Tax=Micromonospora andamanensis TaxID=1287068 RepID=UPI0019516A5C|nr:DUF4913 domain-containing protein [Micromonospora andamanensis]GIJ40519.1 hypothetical protein Vwe01_38440 [Micromonospora andamanensis]